MAKQRRSKARGRSQRTGKVGQPLLLRQRPEIVDEICSNLELGCSRKDACQAAGISNASLYVWLQKAEESDDPNVELYREFRDRVELAESTGNRELVQEIRIAAREDWRAGAHLLACRDPANYSPRRRHEVTGEGGGPVALDAKALLETKLARLCGDDEEDESANL